MSKTMIKRNYNQQSKQAITNQELINILSSPKALAKSVSDIDTIITQARDSKSLYVTEISELFEAGNIRSHKVITLKQKVSRIEAIIDTLKWIKGANIDLDHLHPDYRVV